MYRVLAARSLKFLEQRDEDVAMYQRALHQQSKGMQRTLAGSRSASSLGRGKGSRHTEEKEGRGSGGPFWQSPTDSVGLEHGSYARSSGEKAPVSNPLLGKQKDGDGQGGLTRSQSHATILINDKANKDDLLNMRIRNSIERQKNRTYMLVDEAMQRRRRKALQKESALDSAAAELIQQATAKQRKHEHDRPSTGSASNTPRLIPATTPKSSSASSSTSVGVWSSLGHQYMPAGTPDVDLPELNNGIPLRELTRQRAPRPAPMKEASDHRKKYEQLVEMFRAQRHHYVQAPRRDGFDGVPKMQEESVLLNSPVIQQLIAPSFPANANANAANSTNAATSSSNTASPPSWDINPILLDMSTSVESGVNPSNQSLLARLYQTQNKQVQKIINGAAAAKPSNQATPNAQTSSSTGEEGGTPDSGKSASTPAPPSALSAPASPVKSSHKIVPKDPLRSVDRIAALQPRKWDQYSVRPMASSASVPNFDRRDLGSGHGTRHGLHRGSGSGLSIDHLPDNHPAHIHPNTRPSSGASVVRPGQLAASPSAPALMSSSGTGASTAHTMSPSPSASSVATAPTAPLPSTSASPIPGSGAPDGGVKRGVRFSGGIGLAMGGAASDPNLTADELEAIRRREKLAIKREMLRKRRAKEEKARQQAAAVASQLAESRIDHLNRWRNAFDSTKQKVDRLLIKRLVSRAESRAYALESAQGAEGEGDGEAIKAIIEAVTARQERQMRRLEKDSQRNSDWSGRLSRQRPKATLGERSSSRVSFTDDHTPSGRASPIPSPQPSSTASHTRNPTQEEEQKVEIAPYSEADHRAKNVAPTQQPTTQQLVQEAFAET